MAHLSGRIADTERAVASARSPPERDKRASEVEDRRIRSIRFPRFAGMLLSLGTALGAAQTAAAFDRVVVIGDSLSDSGNAGRFSGGMSTRSGPGGPW